MKPKKVTDEMILEYALESGVNVITGDAAHEAYDDFIDEIDGPVKIGGCEYTASAVLKKIDDTAYRCGFNDWADGEELDEVGDDYMYRKDIEAIREELENVFNRREKNER